jgi:hypothetical protein
MDGPMMPPAQQHEVGKRRGAAMRPVADVVALSEPDVAPRESTSLVAVLQGSPEGGWDRPRAGSDLQQIAVGVVAHDDPAGVAGETLRRFRGNADAILERGLAGGIRIGEHRSIDMNDHLVTLSRRARIESIVECRRRQEREGIGLLLLHCRHVETHWCLRGGPVPGTLVEGLASGVQSLHEQSTDLRSQAAPDDDRAVFRSIHVQGPALVHQRGLAGLGLAIHPAPAADDALDVRGGAGAPDAQEAFFRLGRGYAGECADLGVGKLAACESLGQTWQRGQGTSDTNLLAGRAEVEAGTPGEPLGAGAEAIVPAALEVELTDQV